MTEDIRMLIDDFIANRFLILEKNNSNGEDTTKIPSTAIGIDQSNKKFVMIPLPWDDDNSKIEILNLLGKKCYDDKLYKLALINDAVMKLYEKEPDHLTDLPLTYPSSMRTKCLALVYIDIKDPKENFFRAHPYRITEGKLIKDEPLSFDGNVITIDSLIMNYIIFGFLKAAVFEEFQKRELMSSNFTKEIGDVLLKDILKEFPGANTCLLHKKDEN